MMRWVSALLLSIAVPATTPVHAEDIYPPAVLLKALHQVQEGLAYGDRMASAAQSELLARIETDLGKPVGDAQFSLDRDKAIIGFALSGGSAVASKNLLSKISKESRHFAISEAARFYVSGDMDEAARRFAAVDPRTVAEELRPYILLALGTAALGKDLALARRSFESVALEAPGTLPEEVALRRLVALALTADDLDIFSRASNLYLRRYVSSPYAVEFFDSFAIGVVRLVSSKDFADFWTIVNQLPHLGRRTLISRLLTACAVNGRFDLLRPITHDAALNLPDPGEPLATRLRLFRLVANAKSLDNPTTFAEAKDSNFEALDPADRLLKEKALQTFDTIFGELRAEASNGQVATPSHNPQLDLEVPDSAKSTSDDLDGGGEEGSGKDSPIFRRWPEAQYERSLHELGMVSQYLRELGT